MIKSTLLLVILLNALAEGQITGGGRPGRSLPQHCEGRLEFEALPSENGGELYAEGEEKGNLRSLIHTLTMVDGVRSKQSYKAKSYGNCCWILYSK